MLARNLIRRTKEIRWFTSPSLTTAATATSTTAAAVTAAATAVKPT